MSILRFAGRTVLVTGGASRIGAATARRLAAEGATVAVADLDEPGAIKVAAEIDGYGVRLDVVDLASVQSAIKQVERAIGPVDVLVNNAGGDRTAYFVDSSPPDWDHWIAVNLRGTMACTHVVLPGMQDRRRGAIAGVAHNHAAVIDSLYS